jgi:carbon-monoxide dehydrogenase large subunit
VRRVTGARPDSGDYAALLEALLDAAGYADLRVAQDRARAAGLLRGLGLAVFVEPCGSGWETATVTLHADGRATVSSGGSTQGHGRETAYAAIAADALGLDPDAVTVTAGDTDTCPEGIGALASRSTPIGGSAVLAASRAARARVDSGASLPLTERLRYTAPHEAWAAGACLAEVSVDPDTGVLTVGRLTAIDDAGRIVNPMLAAGQITGGLAQGFGEAVMEALHIDADGQVLTGSFMDYALPRATDMPPVTLLHGPESATDANLLGAKGVGEGGTIGAPAAILNAACDALAPLGVTDLQMPLTPHAIWQAIRAAKETR